tara:strand:+ start:1300 stop:1506 length:207 start_codon:yes stop_codon:yes gene_type:complete
MARYYSKKEVLSKLRGYIAENYSTQKKFAEKEGVTSSYVSGVINGIKAIPNEWLKLIGFEPETIYKKS